MTSARYGAGNQNAQLKVAEDISPWHSPGSKKREQICSHNFPQRGNFVGACGNTRTIRVGRSWEPCRNFVGMGIEAGAENHTPWGDRKLARLTLIKKLLWQLRPEKSVGLSCLILNKQG